MIASHPSGSNVPPPSERLLTLRPLQTPAPPNFEQLLRTVRRVADRYDTPATPLRDGERLLEEMLRRIREDDWAKVPLSFVIRVAGFAFAREIRDRAEMDPIRSFLLAEVAASTRQGFLNPMVRIYLETFVPDSRHTRALGRALRGAEARLGFRWRELPANVPDLFDADRAAGAIAERMEAMDDPWHGLRSLGLRQPHAPSVMDLAHLAFIERINLRLDERREIDRLLGWLKPAGQSPRQVGAGAAITALLRPWAGRTPAKEISSLLIDRLTEFYGHPRANRQAAWNEVDPGLERLFLRWLMGADFRFLFRILNEVERGHMWPDREKYWGTMLERGLVDELWVAFNGEGYLAAMRKLPEDARSGARRFGQQTGEKDKSLLLMRIGNKIVVEGTYNFKVHIFDTNHKKAPKLYQPKYDVADIRALPHRDAIAHIGYWQGKVDGSLSR